MSIKNIDHDIPSPYPRRLERANSWVIISYNDKNWQRGCDIRRKRTHLMEVIKFFRFDETIHEGTALKVLSGPHSHSVHVHSAVSSRRSNLT